MAAITTEIDNLKHEIEKTNQALSHLYGNLGEAGCNYHKAIACQASNEVFEKLCICKKEYDDIDFHLNSVKNALKDLDNKDKEISDTNISIRDLDLRADTLTASLGAIALELASQGVLPKSLEKCLDNAKKFENEMQKCIAKRDSLAKEKSSFLLTLADRKVQSMKNNIDKVFYDTGKKLLEDENLSQLKNDRASAILDELELIKTNRKDFKAMVKQSLKSRDDVQNILREENKTLKEMAFKRQVTERKLEELYTKYGSIIALEIDRWLDAGAPEVLKDIASRIKVEQTRLAKQNLNMEYLLAQKEIELSNNQMDQLRVQLSHLMEQRTLVDRQILEVKSKMSSLDLNVESLQKKQMAITQKVKTN